ncbi:hypothetical protein BDP27DRAFT_1319807 [Rhodocollybia butyracea]|uniref:Uncharacterized protein n=1 Tax=Rhodocollybia butyracea TaxID=206335 RepID=A0A9P5Q323_9AGAR|nr:hypothetical protein BDP27DRAFT_1319807 [Rhodocollybia butyracea]
MHAVIQESTFQEKLLENTALNIWPQFPKSTLVALVSIASLGTSFCRRRKKNTRPSLKRSPKLAY